MGLPLVAIAYANNVDHPLPGLRDEDDQVHQYLQSRSTIQPFRIVRESFATRDRLVQLLTTPEDRDALLTFSYSGHAGGNQLITEEEATNARGLASLLSQCPNLKLIVLNGCSTKNQVNLLLQAFARQQRPAPVIIATASAVGDKAAKDFGIVLFRQLFLYNSSIERSFDTALAAAQTQVGTADVTVEKSVGRGAIDTATADEGSWGMYAADESDWQWTVSLALTPRTAAAYEPNRELFRSLIVTLRKYNSRIQDVWDNEQGIVNDFSPYDDDLLKSFPHPISVQLRKLRAIRGRSDGDDMTFYNQAGRDRLWQLLRTYQTVMNILLAILQSEWWNCLNCVTHESAPGDEAGGPLFTSQRPTYELARQIAEHLRQRATGLFVTELLANEGLLEQIAKTGVYFDGLQPGIGRMSEAEAVGGCQLAEKYLSELLKNVAFLAQYKLISVKNISIIKNRVATQPRYTHRIYQYWQTYLDPILRNTTSDFFLDNTSVLLQKKTGDPNQYLNLSPFLIDENTFQEKATLSNLFAWRASRRNGEELIYEHLLRFDGPTLTLYEIDPTEATDDDQQRNLLYHEMKKQLDVYFGLKDRQTPAAA